MIVKPDGTKITIAVDPDTTVDELREDMVPEGDEVALKRFNSGITNVANLVQNMANRRRHRLPESHRDFRVKDE